MQQYKNKSKNIMIKKLVLCFIFAFSVLNSYSEEVVFTDIRIDDGGKRSEVPVDVDVDDSSMTIFIREDIDWLSLSIEGMSKSLMTDIESASSGEVYKIGMTDFPSGLYDITILTDDGMLNGNFEL